MVTERKTHQPMHVAVTKNICLERKRETGEGITSPCSGPTHQLEPQLAANHVLEHLAGPPRSRGFSPLGAKLGRSGEEGTRKGGKVQYLQLPLWGLGFA